MQGMDETEQALFYMARNNLIHFAKSMIPDYYAEDFHEELAKKLTEVYEGEEDRLIVSVPPRMGKSELCSRLFPAWCLGKDPSIRFIVTSYSQPLASDFSFDCREYLRDDKYSKIFPNTQIHPKFRSKEEWKTTDGGHYIAAGVEGSITGKGCDVAIIDDPHKSYEEAQSKRQREKVWDWYTGTLRTRLSSEAAMIVVSTRWHSEDLVGKLLESETSDQWTFINYPAIKDNGEPLCPNIFPMESIKATRADMGYKKFLTEYQGTPIDEGDGEVDIDDLETIGVDSVPAEDIKWIRAWDLAFTKGSDWSRTASVQVGFHKSSGSYYIRSLRYGSWNWKKVKRKVCDIAEKEQVKIIFGVGGTQVSNYEEIKEELEGRMPPRMIDKMAENEPKKTRIRRWFTQINSSNIYLVKDGSNWGKLMYEINQFPDGDFDDMVDACAMAFSYMSDKSSGVQTGTLTPVSITSKNIGKYSREQ